MLGSLQESVTDVETNSRGQVELRQCDQMSQKSLGGLERP